MAGPDPKQLRRLIDRFPQPPDDDRADDLLDGAYGRMAGEWYDRLYSLVDAYAGGDALREELLVHAEAVPAFRLSDGAAPLPERRRRLTEAAAELPEIAEVAVWYSDLRDLLEDDPDDLTLVERALHDFGYAVAHGLFLGVSAPETVVRRLRFAYRLVGVRIDDTASDGAERTTFTCPYRDLGAGRCGKRWLCHEKLDRVDDGYVTYLAERGIDYQRPRGCAGSEQCYSAVARESPERWWPKTLPAAVSES
ncbi:hypothetical protein SAMN04488066_108118 [Halorubrum aquaticum]|uniref:L-2-amino-thiazoline-4-carboxylic acid hydrolase n=1 Tax=Halorubrum aquaticum TaxID=387340 RepID=A0A1I3B105_9EURY|nr:hypothetical protein [Halorubrum aquaticum]SFH55860.1 hypothetical protein SAMN04488066_108118 [Halorubrum aquaticum]